MILIDQLSKTGVNLSSPDSLNNKEMFYCTDKVLRQKKTMWDVMFNGCPKQETRQVEARGSDGSAFQITVVNLGYCERCRGRVDISPDCGSQAPWFKSHRSTNVLW